MTAHDICSDIAALLNPLPDPDDLPEGETAPLEAVMEERDEQAEALRLAWSEGEIDPLLSSLEGLRQQRLQLESQMRQLIAYARRFTHPRPYKLVDLAAAAGLSISGTRIAFDDEDLEQVAEILGRPPAPAAGRSSPA